MMDHTKHVTVAGVVTAVMAPIITIVALALIVAVLSSSQLRQSLRHLVFVSMSVSDLIVGVFCCSMVARIELDKSKVRSIDCLAAVSALAYFSTVSVFITFWSLVLLHGSYIARLGTQLLHVSPPKLSPLAQTLLRVAVALSPWLVMFAVLPGMLVHFTQRKYSSIPEHIELPNELCHRLQMEHTIWLKFHALCLYAPVCLAVLLSAVSAVLFILHRRNARMDSTGLLDEPEAPVENPGIIIVGTIAAVVLALPFNINVMVIHLLELDDAEKIFRVFVAALYLRLINTAKSVVLPAIWFADGDVRERVKAMIPESCRVLFPFCRQGEGHADGVSVTYQDLVENDNARSETAANRVV